MTDKVILKDFKDTPYYDIYKERINDYAKNIINSIVSMQWIDNKSVFTRGDVLKEVLKIVTNQLAEFPEDIDLNPNKEAVTKERMDKIIEEQAKQMIWLN